VQEKAANHSDSRECDAITRAAAEFLVLALMALVPTITVYVDVMLIGHGVPDPSVTELTQEALILISSILFWRLAYHSREHRGFYVLVAGCFGCMFIREQNNLLDSLYLGAWMVPAMLLALSSMGYALIVWRPTIIPGMAAFVRSRSYLYILFGLVVLLVFSRAFGSGHLLWRQMMQGEYSSVFKRALQEGLELLGYLFIGYGSWLYYRASRRARRALSG